MKLDIKYSEPSDEYIINQTLAEYNGIAPFLKDAKVLDIGAHIGCFSKMALLYGATHVTSVEPNPVSANHLRDNMKEFEDRSTIIEAAGVGGDETSVTLRWLGTTWRGRPPADSRVEWQGRPYQFAKAKTIRFTDLLLCEPNVIKMDCEGAEYSMLQSIEYLPECVTTFTAEWHKFTSTAYDQYVDCIGRLQNWGFKTDKLIRMGPKAFSSYGNFIRPIAWRR